MNENCTIVIMGATGDLSRIKLLPALYELFKSGKLKKFSVVGTASSKIDPNLILDKAKLSVENIDENLWKSFAEKFYYYPLDFSKPEDYEDLKINIDEIESKNGLSGKRLFYLATLPEYFEPISDNLAKVRLVKDAGGSQRVIYEKPFGRDLKSAQEINSCIGRVFDEKNIYRADHYLGKELVGNIALVRFTNRILEPLWSNRDIDSVQIILDENFGIKNRGKYYDSYGAVRDILQSHALQMLSLVAMESPDKLTGEHIRIKKTEILKKTKITDIILGQYEGYANEANVKPDSHTETFFAAKLSVDNPRWKGVPFYIRAGKNLSKKETVIHIKFKDVDCLLAKSCPSDSNYLTIRIEPDEGFGFEINSKAKDTDFDIETVHLDCNHGPDSHNRDAYVILIEQALKGEQSFFIGKDEIEFSWKIVDAVKSEKSPVFRYTVGSNGPKEFETWSQKHHVFWKS